APGVGSDLARAGDVGLVGATPEVGVVGIREKRHVGRRLERERIARLAARGGLLVRQLERRRWQAGNLVAVGDVERERVGRVQYVLARSVEHTSELQSRENLVCRLL